MSHRERAESAIASTRQFLEAATKIGVLSPGFSAEIRSYLDSRSTPPGPLGLARHLIRRGVMSQLQARCLLHGRGPDLIVGRYVISCRIGSGSFGRVYRASDPLLGRDVALKLIDVRQSNSPEVVARFRREMKMAGRLSHPSIVRAYDAGRAGSRLYIAMELIAGSSLEKHLRRRGPLDPQEVVRHATRAALGLAHAHARGVIHRDVKPDNILVDRWGSTKLLDFGLGVLAERENADGFATDTSLVVGTANFLSPEQACGRPIDGRSDLYSLGCTMYYLITGALPFGGDSPIERIAARLAGEAAPMINLRPGLPNGVVEVIGRLMARRPADRFPDAASAATALGRLGRTASASWSLVRSCASNLTDDIPISCPPARTAEAATPRTPRVARLLGAFFAAFGRRTTPPTKIRANA